MEKERGRRGEGSGVVWCCGFEIGELRQKMMRLLKFGFWILVE